MKINFWNCILFLVLFNLHSVLGLETIPQLLEGDHTAAFNVSASDTKQILVRTKLTTIRTSTFELYMNFKLKELHADYGVTEMEFCFMRSIGSLPSCKPVKLSETVKGFSEQNTEISFMNVDKYKGFSVKITILSPVGTRSNQFGAEGIYFAKFANKRGNLVTNYIECFDYFFYYLKMTVMSGSPTLLNMMVDFPVKGFNDLPMELKCSQYRLPKINPPQYFKNFFHFKWRQCVLTGRRKFDECKVALQSLDWPKDYYNIRADGTLVIYKLPYDSLQGGISCTNYWENEDYIFYSGFDRSNAEPSEEGKTVLIYSPFFNSSTKYSKTEIKPLQTPLTQDLFFRKGEADSAYENILSADYEANINEIDYTWTKDDQTINLALLNGEKPNKFKLKLPQTLGWEHSGKYKLTIQQRKPVGRAPVTFTFNVRVINPPEVTMATYNWPKKIFTMANKSLELTCQFTNATEIKLFMNGMELSLQNQNSLKSSYDAVVRNYDYLANLDFELSDIPPKPENGLRYSINQIAFDNDKSEGQSHSISCEGKNQYGRLNLNSAIVVLKPPEIIKMPSKFNCSHNCKANVNHTFPCEIDTKYYREKTGLKVDEYWMFNNVNLNNNQEESEYKKYFSVDDEMNLILSPIPDDAKIRPKLTDARFHCCLILSDPDTQEMIYDSTKDPIKGPQLTVSVKLNEKPAVLNIAWITPLVVVILLLLLIIILIVVIRRPKEEAYNVDKEERAQGNDPILEMKEKESFKPYERPEEVAYPGRRTSLGDDSLGVGDDDMGELEEYDMDPSNFDEEGSFLGEYSDKPKKPNNNVRHC